jgi:cytoskeletal protein RodZ
VTTMRMTIYAVLAVAVGIALVGVLPTQLAAVTNQQGSRSFALQTTGQGNKTGGSEVTGHQAKTDSNATISTDSDQAKAAASAGEESSNFSIAGLTDAERAQEFNANVKYYGLWVVNLVLALGVYFLAKRRLG